MTEVSSINLVFYSDQIIAENEKIDIRLAEIIQGKAIGYIPSGPDLERRFFNAKREYYKKYDLDLAIFYDLDVESGGASLEALLSCNAIHLSGGDTEAFLLRLRRCGMVSVLRDWAMRGGLLIGTSAGGILMTPTIALDALFQHQIPEDVQDKAALDLVPFEFFPHAQKEGYLQNLLAYSARSPRPIVACPDGAGVIVSGHSIECFGNPSWFSRGEELLEYPKNFSDVDAIFGA